MTPSPSPVQLSALSDPLLAEGSQTSDTPPAAPARRRPSDRAFGLLLILPSLLLFLGLVAYPLLQALLLSLHATNTLTLDGPFVGLDNYRAVLARDDFWTSFANSLIWTVGSLIGQFGVGIALALLLNMRFAGRSLAQGVMLLPYMLGSVVAVLIWQWMLNDMYGVIDAKLMEWEITMMPLPWLTQMPNAMLTLIGIGTWKLFPFVVITILARLQSIPPQLYEAARIDGAGAFARFWDITLPQIRSVLLFLVLLRGIWDLKEFDLIYLMTGGGPQIGTQTLPLLIYKEAFGQLHLGRGAAIAVLMLILMTVMFGAYVLVNRHYERRESR